MIKHYLEAVIGTEYSKGYRVVCEDPDTCGKEQYTSGCLFQNQFIRFGLNMVNVPESEIVLGRIEVNIDTVYEDVSEGVEESKTWITPN